MKYMLMIYGNEELWSSFPQEELEQVVADTDALQAELEGVGRVRRRLRRRRPGAGEDGDAADGVPVVTDGPYLEAKEYLGSFDIIDVDSLERALEIAARVPFARIGQVEVRPLMHEAPDERSDRRRPAHRGPAARRSRRRSSARWCAGTATSTPPRTRCRRRSSRPSVQWPAAGTARQPGGVAVDGGDAPADRPAAQRRRAPPTRGDRRRRAPIVSSRDADDRARATTTRSRCCSCAATRRCRRRRSSRSRCARSAASPPPRSRARSSCPRRRWRSASAGPSSRSRPRARPSGSRPTTSAPSGCGVVLHVLYLVFNEGYTTSAGDDLQRTDLTDRGDPPRPHAARAAARRRRGRRAARADAAHRRPPRASAPRADGALVPARRAGPRRGGTTR